MKPRRSPDCDRRRPRRVGVVLGALLVLGLPAPARASVQAAFDCSPSCAVTAGATVIFTSTSTSTAPIRNYEWDLDGDGLFGAGDDPDEPFGPGAGSAQRAFPDSGDYGIGLRVTNGDADQSVVRRAVTVSAAPRPPGELTYVPVDFAREGVHGPFLLSRRALSRAARGPAPRPAPEGELEEDEVGVSDQAAPCGTSACGGAAATQVGLSPPLASNPFHCCQGEIDPQVAVSDSTVLVGLRHHLQAFDKAGQQLFFPPDPEASSQVPPKPYDLSLCKLFKPLIPDMNAELAQTLPQDLDDNQGNAITVENGYGINCEKQTGGTRPAAWWDLNHKDGITNADFYWEEFFDARVLWDEEHGRFVIAALVMNHNTNARKKQAREDAGSVNSGTYNAVLARRNLLAVAVSKTDDPRDGFYEYWTWGYPGQGDCPSDHCAYQGASDYLTAGISSKNLVLENTVADPNVAGGHDDADVNMPDLINGKLRREITVVPTAPMAAGQGPTQLTAYQNPGPFTNPDGTEANSIVQPATQHPPGLGGYHLFASKWRDTKQTAAGTDDENTVLLWALSLPSGGGEPTMYNTALPLQSYRDVDAAAPQRLHPDFISGDVQFFPAAGLANNAVNKLIYRNANLYLTFDTCSTWGDACNQSMLRYARIKLNGIDNFGGVLTANLGPSPLDLSLGASGSFEAPPGDAWYAFPTVEANEDGDAALVFHRSAPNLYPEARYSVQLDAEAYLRGSRALEKGSYTLGKGTAPVGSWHHYAAMSVDPYDETAIWMIQGYGTKYGYRSGTWTYAIAKVFGKRHPNLVVNGATLGKGGSASKLKLKLRLADLGDGGARPSKASLKLSRAAAGSSAKGGRDLALKQFSVPRIASGAARTMALTVRVPPRARHRGYRYLTIRLDAKTQVREYDEHDNTISVRLGNYR